MLQPIRARLLTARCPAHCISNHCYELAQRGAHHMKLTSCLRLLALSFGLLLLPAFAAAQDSVKCESNDGNRQYCGSYNPSQVQFDRQISEAPCIQRSEEHTS